MAGRFLIEQPPTAWAFLLLSLRLILPGPCRCTGTASRSEAMRVFQQFDANQDGTIDGGELMTCDLAHGHGNKPPVTS
eukprot:Skav206668  [mRNA]  locus=scaffold56:167870:168103:+ [translate_table: standard]